MESEPGRNNNVPSAAPAKDWVSLIVVGIGVGLLAGFSVSPTMPVILASLTGAAATMIALFRRTGRDKVAAVEEESKPVPIAAPTALAVLVWSILFGAAAGVFVRTTLAERDLSELRALDLAPPESIQESIKGWTDLGLEKKFVTTELFQAYLGNSKAIVENEAKEVANARDKVLNSATAPNDCPRLRTAGEDLHEEMRESDNEKVVDLANVTNNLLILKKVIDLICTQ